MVSGNQISKRQWSTYISMAAFILAGGIEYSVIFPTMLDYLISMGGEEWLYGLSLAAFSISNLITAPLYGVIFDMTHRTKYIVLFANLFEIGGNFLYFSARSKYMILGSRFLVGIGAGAGACIFGELSHTTKKEVRTTVFSVFMGIRQIGLVIGPAFNLFLSKCNFSVGPFSVYSLTAPGAFMVMVWLVVELMFLFFFFSMPAIPDSPPPPSSFPQTDVKNEDMIVNTGPPTVTNSTKDMFQNTASSYSEKTPLLFRKNRSFSDPTMQVNQEESPMGVTGKVEVGEGKRRWWKEWYPALAWRMAELVKEETVLLLILLFVTMFNQTAIETMFVPMAKKLLQWDEEQISIFFSVAGVVIILSFVLVTLLSRCVADRSQIVAGLLIELLAYTLMIVLVANANSETPWILVKFLVCCVVAIFGLPLFLVTSASLYSKLLPPRIQGFGQGVRKSMFSVAAIMGPLWAGGSVSISYYILLGVPLALLGIVMVLLTLSFTRLVERR